MVGIYTLNNIFPLGQDHFYDGTLRMNVPDGIVPFGIFWKYENDSELFSIICLRKHYEKYELELTMPYVPHARMDRVKKNTEIFTLKHFCDIINSLNFKSVNVYDVHSNVSTALLNRVVNFSPYPELDIVLHSISYDETGETHFEKFDKTMENLVVFFPDEGAMKRYSEELPPEVETATFGIKHRDWATGKILNYEVINPEVVKDKIVLIVDDICCRGGTFYHAATQLKEAGAKTVYLFVSHAENSMYDGEMYNSDLIEKIFTTDSICKDYNDKLDKVQIIKPDIWWKNEIYSRP